MMCCRWVLTCYFLSCLTCWPQSASSAETESIELQSVLFSHCKIPEQKAKPQDLQPIRVLYQALSRAGEHASYRYWDFDLGCKTTTTGSGSLTTGQFENAWEKLKRAGLREGKTVAPPESSGNEWPISFLKLRTQGQIADVYTMYLRYRWSGKMQTEDTVAARIIEQWRSLEEEIASLAPSGASQQADIVQIARDCADGWPPSIRRWVWSNAQSLVAMQNLRSDCSASFGRP